MKVIHAASPPNTMMSQMMPKMMAAPAPVPELYWEDAADATPAVAAVSAIANRPMNATARARRVMVDGGRTPSECGVDVGVMFEPVTFADTVDLGRSAICSYRQPVAISEQDSSGQSILPEDRPWYVGFRIGRTAVPPTWICFDPRHDRVELGRFRPRLRLILLGAEVAPC